MEYKTKWDFISEVYEDLYPTFKFLIDNFFDYYKTKDYDFPSELDKIYFNTITVRKSGTTQSKSKNSWSMHQEIKSSKLKRRMMSDLVVLYKEKEDRVFINSVGIYTNGFSIVICGNRKVIIHMSNKKYELKFTEIFDFASIIAEQLQDDSRYDDRLNVYQNSLNWVKKKNVK